MHFNGSTWSDMSTTPVNLNELWMDAPGRCFAVGDQGTVKRWDGGEGNDLVVPSPTDPLLSVSGTSASDVWVVGALSAAFRWNGSGWKVVNVDTYNIHNFHGIHGTGPDDIDIATEYLGPRPSAPATGDTRGAYHAALHAGGLVFHWDGSQWYPLYQDPFPTSSPCGVTTARMGSRAAKLPRFVGNANADPVWTRITDVENLPFFVTSVWGFSASNVLVVGDDGTIVQYSP